MFAKDELQFYPTSPDLAKRAWSLFKIRPFSRVLEPSAGNGDLAMQAPFYSEHISGNNKIDCIEIDIERHCKLREKKLTVVGVDFLSLSNADIYSHVIMNPPFAQGVEHVMFAWNMLFEGEIVAIINAESIKNPYTRQRKELTSLIEQYGSVEFIQEAFMTEDTRRKTEVEVALIYLNKVSNYENNFIEDILKEQKVDEKSGDDFAFEFKQEQEIALTKSFIENSVITFNAAIQSAKKSVFAQAKAAYYSAMLGETMANMNNGMIASYEAKSFKYIRKNLMDDYEVLKDKAWANILRSSNVKAHLSAKAQAKVESEFDSIKKLDFTVANIYGFIAGLLANKGEIQKEMVLEVFDTIVRYHEENTVFHLGWKSNNKHRTGGFRIKTTRFIIPNHASNYKKSADYRTLRFLSDFDKVFAMLDGKTEVEVSLESAFRDNYSALYDGERIDSTYFQIRYYHGRGTIHFFAKNKQLIERLNRFVGRMREWLPPRDEMANDAFWEQYNCADKFDKELRISINGYNSRWNNKLDSAVYSGRGEQKKTLEDIGEKLMPILEKYGIDVDGILENKQTEFTLIEQKAA